MELGNFAVGNTVGVEVMNQTLPNITTLVSFTSRVTQVDIFGLDKFGVMFENGVVIQSCLADLEAGLVTSELA